MANTRTLKYQRRRKRRRERAFLAQGGRCWLCGESMKLHGDLLRDPLAATWDHVIPRCMGGSGKRDNLMLAHKACNASRRHEGEPWL